MCVNRRGCLTGSGKKVRQWSVPIDAVWCIGICITRYPPGVDEQVMPKLSSANLRMLPESIIVHVGEYIVRATLQTRSRRRAPRRSQCSRFESGCRYTERPPAAGRGIRRYSRSPSHWGCPDQAGRSRLPFLDHHVPRVELKWRDVVEPAAPVVPDDEDGGRFRRPVFSAAGLADGVNNVGDPRGPVCRG